MVCAVCMYMACGECVVCVCVCVCACGELVRDNCNINLY